MGSMNQATGKVLGVLAAASLSACSVTNTVQSGNIVDVDGKPTKVPNSNHAYITTSIGIGTASSTKFINVDYDKYKAHLELSLRRAEIDPTSRCAVQILNLMCPGGAGQSTCWVPAEVTFKNDSLLDMGVKASQIAAFASFAINFKGFPESNVVQSNSQTTVTSSSATGGAATATGGAANATATGTGTAIVEGPGTGGCPTTGH